MVHIFQEFSNDVKYLPNEHCCLLGDCVVNERVRSRHPVAQSLAGGTVTPSSPPSMTIAGGGSILRGFTNLNRSYSF